MELPGAKNRISMLFSGVNPFTSGHTTGRSSSVTKHSACSSWFDVNGRRISSAGGVNAANATGAAVFQQNCTACHGADLTGADLRRTDMSKTTLLQANLQGALLDGARLRHAHSGSPMANHDTTHAPIARDIPIAITS